MQIKPEIELTSIEHEAVTELRNQSFPSFEFDRSYFKQLPHMRALEVHNDRLVAYMGLDYRAVRVGSYVYNVLGVIDFCVDKEYRKQGIGSRMLSELTHYAEEKNVDFIVLMSELNVFYLKNGFQRVELESEWLRINEHKSYGIASEYIDDLYIKKVGAKEWYSGPMDWLGYMY